LFAVAGKARVPGRDSATTPAILIVEDELLVRLGAAQTIEAAGFEVIQAANADEAIRILEYRSDIRVVFTDVEMPGSMDGLKLAHAVRNRWPPIKLVVTSGHVEVAEQDLPQGGRFFAKPYDLKKITDTLRELTY
jgi:YesN/AraC family two-component response regulator